MGKGGASSRFVAWRMSSNDYIILDTLTDKTTPWHMTYADVTNECAEYNYMWTHEGFDSMKYIKK